MEEGEEVGERFQGNTAPSSPVLDKFSELSLSQDAFRSQQGEPECTETTNTTNPLTAHTLHLVPPEVWRSFEQTHNMSTSTTRLDHAAKFWE